MAYRRSESVGVESSRWRLSHRPALVECGIPTAVVDSDRRWAYVLLHGSDEFGTGWTPSWLSVEQAARLLRLLEAHIADDAGLDLVAALRRRLSGAAGRTPD